MRRQVTPELLDQLPAGDRRAMASRRDLQKVNGWMGHVRILANVVREGFRGRPPRSVVEIGAGDGTLLLKLARALGPAWTPATPSSWGI